jgi:Fe-S-cluster-containing hydrogenase component 2
MARPLWFVELLKKAFPNIRFLAKLTNLPILGTIFDFFLFRGDDIIYLPQDKVININESLGEYQEYVLPSQVLEHFIKKAKYHWIMNFCICRSSMNCQNYPVDLGCLFLGDAVLDINPQLGKLVTEDQALEHLKKCRDAGLVHMVGKNRLDAQWLGVSSGDKLLSICNCDPCCCLWRVSPILAPKIGSKIKKMSGVVVRVSDKCIGCGTCLEDVCFVNAISFEDNKAVISNQCRGCGRCVDICPQNAIELILNDKKYLEKSIHDLEKLIDIT